MNSRMNDFVDLRERAREEEERLEHLVTCPLCGEAADSRMLHVCTHQALQEDSRQSRIWVTKSGRLRCSCGLQNCIHIRAVTDAIEAMDEEFLNESQWTVCPNGHPMRRDYAHCNQCAPTNPLDRIDITRPRLPPEEIRGAVSGRLTSPLGVQQSAPREDVRDPRYAYDAKCTNHRGCGRIAQRFNTIAEAQRYVGEERHTCPTCHRLTLGIQAVNLEAEDQRRLRRPTPEAIEAARTLGTSVPRRQHIPYTDNVVESEQERRDRVERERLEFNAQFGGRSGDEARRRLARIEHEELRAQTTFLPLRKLDLDD